MKYFSLVTFVSGILLSGCSYTEGNLELKGKVIDKDTKIAVPDRKIFIVALVEEDDMFISSKVVGTFFTDSLGCFAYTLKKVKTVYLYDFYIFGDSAYAFSYNRLGLTELNRYDKFLSFNLSRLTDLSIKLDRISKTPLWDTLYVSWRSKGVDGKILYPYKVENNGYTLNSRLEWIGGNVNSVIRTKVYADEKTIVRFKLFRDGKYTQIVDTVFCIRNAVNNVNFKY